MGERGFDTSNVKKETKLQRMRAQKGMTQKELALKSKISVRTLQCYEQRTRAIDTARLSTLCDLSNALDCRIGDILESQNLIKKHNECK